MPDSQIPNLLGKIVAVKYGGGERDYAYMEAAGIELQAGRHFLVGKTVNVSNEDAGDVRLCIPWDGVTAYYEFDSLDDCRKAIARWYPEKKTRGFWSS